MKLLRFGPKGRERPGVLDTDGRIRDLSGVVADIDARDAAPTCSGCESAAIDSLPIAADEVRIGAPVAGVGKIICVGLNYSDHARETGRRSRASPFCFSKRSSSIVGPNDDVVLPPGAEKGDWEVELGIVIAREARYVPLANALDYVAGACVVNDVSERSYQLERGGQWDKGKGCDTFCPLGPYLVTLEEIERLDDLRMWCTVNGRTVQDGNTRTMIFDVPYLVHYISQFMSLQPGDVISTGTPPGVGMGMKPPQWLEGTGHHGIGHRRAGDAAATRRAIRRRGALVTEATKLAVVTGGNSGIGYETVVALASQGWDVAVSYIHDETAAATVARQIESHGRRAWVRRCDVGIREDVENFFDSIVAAFGTVPTLLVNNAAVQTWSPFLHLEEASWDQVIRTNLKGCFLEHAEGGETDDQGGPARRHHQHRLRL